MVMLRLRHNANNEEDHVVPWFRDKRMSGMLSAFRVNVSRISGGRSGGTTLRKPKLPVGEQNAGTRRVPASSLLCCRAVGLTPVGGRNIQSSLSQGDPFNLGIHPQQNLLLDLETGAFANLDIGKRLS